MILVTRAIGDPGGEQSSSVGDLDGEHREHLSRIEVVSIQLQKPTLMEQVKT
jgi:hypothetical protein